MRDPLTSGAAHQVLHALLIGQLASRVAVVKLADVAVKVGLADMVVRAVDRPLEFREGPLIIGASDRFYSLADAVEHEPCSLLA